MQHGASFFLEGLAVRRLVLVSCIQFRACARCLASQKISSIEEIANDLVEQDVPLIQKIMDVAARSAPDYNVDEIYNTIKAER